MNKYIILISLFISSTAWADVSNEQIEEVKYLLNFVKESGCTMKRNGADYPAEKGVKHIEKKYDYFRDDIKTTEDFIKYSATKSTMSGKFYTVICEKKTEIKTQTWLLNELNEYRNKKTKIEWVECGNPRPEICTMQYVPVCAKLRHDEVKTYASDCNACSDGKVVSYKQGACEK